MNESAFKKLEGTRPLKLEVDDLLEDEELT